jgi:Site-specific recombinase XerD
MGSLYKRQGSNYWYCKYRDRTGKLVRESTGTESEAEAQEYLDKVEGAYERMTLRDAIIPYTDPETNPRRHDAEVDGRMYGRDHAMHVASYTKDLLSEVPESILKKQIAKISRMDCKMVKETIYEHHGPSRSSQERFQVFKTIFSQLEESGVIQGSPARGLHNIGYVQKERFAIDARCIARLIAQKDRFYSKTEWAFFTILATTGMRISEVLCINQRKVVDGSLIIDEAIKGTDGKKGKPKMGKSRIIPLAQITHRVISELTPDANGYFFPQNRSWGKTIWTSIRRTAIASCPDDASLWSQATPHIMRHSLNSNLLGAGVNHILVASYLSWMSKEVDDIQRRYTHIITDDLLPVARMIDSLYDSSPRNDGKLLQFVL